MTAVTLAEIMAGLETRLLTIAELNVTDTLVDSMAVPAAMIGVPDIPSYRESFGRGSYRPSPTIRLFVSKGHMETGQLTLASFADVTGANSIPLAIEADKTLGGLGVNCIVTSFQVFPDDYVAQIGYFGGLFTTQTIARGT